MEYNELEGTVAYGPLLLAPLEGFKIFAVQIAMFSSC